MALLYKPRENLDAIGLMGVRRIFAMPHPTPPQRAQWNWAPTLGQ